MQCKSVLQSRVNNSALLSFYFVYAIIMQFSKNRFCNQECIANRLIVLLQRNCGNLPQFQINRKDIMKQYERTTSYRFSEEVYKKLDMLYEFEKRNAERLKIKPKNRNQIVEEAIENLYFKMINDTQDADVVKRISSMIDDKVSSSMNNLKKTIDEIWFYSKKHDLGNKLLFRSPGILPPPPSISDAINIIVNEESGWNNALEEYMYETNNKEKFERYHTK